MNYLALFENPLDFFIKGGVFMWVLLACSFVALTVILLRLFALRKGEIAPRLIEKTIAAYQPGERLDQLRLLVKGDDSALARIVEVAIRPYHASRSETVDAVQARARRELLGLESGLFILEIIVGIAPLLGLLGAVSGLVHVFGNIGSGVMSTSDLKGIASGIGEALSTTIVGLAIAILSLIAFLSFTRRVETMAVKMESLVTDLVDKLYQNGDTNEEGESTIGDGSEPAEKSRTFQDRSKATRPVEEAAR
jgi:biopolymer transport protein ExbB